MPQKGLSEQQHYAKLDHCLQNSRQRQPNSMFSRERHTAFGLKIRVCRQARPVWVWRGNKQIDEHNILNPMEKVFSDQSIIATYFTED